MKIRKIIQLLVFLLVVSISIGHYLEETGIEVPILSTASLHAVCPLGGVVSAYEYFVSGKYVKKVHESSFILMFIVFGLTIFLGPVFCGWICPFGTFQEWVSKIGKKIFTKRFNTFIPYKIDKYLRFIRYIILVLVLIKTAQSMELMFANIDPYYALFNIWSDEVAITAYIALFITILASLFVERPFCKYFCPYGALLGIINKFKFFKIKRIESTCISCSKCDKNCPMNIPLSDIAKPSTNHQCISCLECTSESSCPKEDTMILSFNKKILKGTTVGLITIVFFVIGIGGSMVFNIWSTESSKIPATYKIAELEGVSNPADIRGSYSLKDVENAFNVPVSELVKAFALDNNINNDSFLIKELEGMYVFPEDIEIGTDSVRLFVALFNDLPYTPETTTRLFIHAKSILKNKIDDKLLVSVPTLITNIEHEEMTLELDIKGKTTFKEAMEMGLTKEDFNEVLGSYPENLNTTIRDYAEEIGLEFSEAKSGFQDRI